MKRLTEYESIGGHAHAVPNGNIDTALMRLADYEDTGYTPSDIHAMRNELCQYCGKYKYAHEGACDRCRWKEM